MRSADGQLKASLMFIGVLLIVRSIDKVPGSMGCSGTNSLPARKIQMQIRSRKTPPDLHLHSSTCEVCVQEHALMMLDSEASVASNLRAAACTGLAGRYDYGQAGDFKA